MNLQPQQQGQPNSESYDFFRESSSITLTQRLQQLDEVDRKVGEIMDFTRELINNLDKDKQISRSKMDENAKRYSKILEEDIMKVITDQLTYMEQLCVGAEHQDSMFRVQNKKRTTNQILQRMRYELGVFQQMDKESEAVTPASDGTDDDFVRVEGPDPEDVQVLSTESDD
ncbi:unnamed protein product [Bursaphelenchus xylophilus]|uniref:Mediator of RNA polymerase II transcription subunit 11 n=1 Tax=Bursaphelenchus xylophilus TaxID=6326 RepID=A0A1I7RPZ4_BURXY|nr:unnamed protein product [Bursaphelenchus xylophilus]CAG9096874.1 unnamed protein product [Bursaphelenchus xylophilus]